MHHAHASVIARVSACLSCWARCCNLIKPGKQGVVIQDAPACICSHNGSISGSVVPHRSRLANVWFAVPNCFLVHSQHLYIVKKMFLYTHLCLDNMNYLCYQMILQLKLFRKSKTVQIIEWIFVTWWLAEYDSEQNVLQSFSQTRSSSSLSYTISSLSHFSRRPLLEIK